MKNKILKCASIVMASTMIFFVVLSLLYLITMMKYNKKIDSNLDFYSNEVIHNVDKILFDGFQTLNELNRLDIDECSDSSIYQLKKINFKNPFILNVTKVQMDKSICSSIQGRKVDELSRLPPDLLFDNDKYWFYQNLNDNDNDNYMVIERGDARIVMKLHMIFDLHSLSNSLLKAEILADDKVVSTSALSIYYGLQLFPENEHLRSVSINSKYKPFSLVVSERKEEALSMLEYLEDDFYLIIIVSALIISLILLGMRRYYNSFKFKFMDGIKNEEFVPYFQPIVDSRCGDCVGAEVLTRWIKRDGRIISPNKFIPEAENLGLMNFLTKYIIVKTLKNSGKFLYNTNYYITLNLSLSDLHDDEVYNVLLKEKNYYGLKSEQLRIELTERQFVDKYSFIGILDKYKKAGFRIYIDDFGTGYSNLAYLESFPIDVLKIDKIFVDTLNDKSKVSPVIQNIIDIARKLNLGIVAEGVENKEQNEKLSALGVYVIQGWLYSKALTFDDWAIYCNENKKTLIHHVIT